MISLVFLKDYLLFFLASRLAWASFATDGGITELLLPNTFLNICPGTPVINFRSSFVFCDITFAKGFSIINRIGPLTLGIFTTGYGKQCIIKI